MTKKKIISQEQTQNEGQENKQQEKEEQTEENGEQIEEQEEQTKRKRRQANKEALKWWPKFGTVINLIDEQNQKKKIDKPPQNKEQGNQKKKEKKQKPKGNISIITSQMLNDEKEKEDKKKMETPESQEKKKIPRLVQKIEDFLIKKTQGVVHVVLPLGFVSQRFTPAQRLFSIFEKELIAILKCFTKFEDILERDQMVFLLTDSQALLWSFRFLKTGLVKIQRYILKLTQFPFKILCCHVEGTFNATADAYIVKQI